MRRRADHNRATPVNRDWRQPNTMANVDYIAFYRRQTRMSHPRSTLMLKTEFGSCPSPILVERNKSTADPTPEFTGFRKSKSLHSPPPFGVLCVERQAGVCIQTTLDLLNSTIINFEIGRDGNETNCELFFGGVVRVWCVMQYGAGPTVGDGQPHAVLRLRRDRDKCRR